jgi:hypothetical protein
MQRLLHEGHKVLYKQLLRWILQGNLNDPFNEFFVKCDNNETVEKSTHGELLTNDDEDLDNSGQPATVKFKLRVDMIPCHISVSTAEKILFIGMYQ